MPYADLERRRRYHREYRRKQRAQQGLTNPSETRLRKAYICPKAPNLRLSGAVFKGGLFVTDDPRIQAVVEGDPAYGSYVFGWTLE